MILGAMITLLFPALFCSCTDDNTFTADRGSVLKFSQDTIRFDTVFTGITSTTEPLTAVILT